MNRRLVVVGAAAAALVTMAFVPTATAERGGRHLQDLRDATAAYHDFDRAADEGFTVVRDLAKLTCIDDSAGGMGTHYVLPSRLDAEISLLEPEILIYDETGDRPTLIAVEYLVRADVWHAAHGKQPPKQFGKKFTLVRAGNRYGLPDFYEQHVWLWKSNPAGLLQDWNPEVSC
ncbi:MAG: hypothetical protein ACRDO4_02240 [Nocardioides sp.]